MKIPKEWTFKDEEVASSFDEHVREQLPWYNIATSITTHIIRNYLPNDGVLVDLGCSTGNITKASAETLKNRNAKIINVDNSPEMEKHFSGFGDFVLSDIEEFEIPNFDVCVMFLSLMFVKPNYREQLIIELMKKTNAGGCIIVIDKMESFSGYSGLVMSRINLHNKIESGCQPDEILQKELSLSGVQRPVKPELMKSFSKWFQIGEFCGYLFER